MNTILTQLKNLKHTNRCLSVIYFKRDIRLFAFFLF